MTRSKTLLLVDDSKVSRLMLKAIIEHQYPECKVYEAIDAAEAVDISEKQAGSIDFITLDMNMPGKDGLTVAPALQSKCPEATIALLTGNDNKSIKAQAEKLGLVFIPKPITEEKVLSMLSDYL